MASIIYPWQFIPDPFSAHTPKKESAGKFETNNTMTKLLEIRAVDLGPSTKRCGNMVSNAHVIAQ